MAKFRSCVYTPVLEMYRPNTLILEMFFLFTYNNLELNVGRQYLMLEGDIYYCFNSS
jgi:hypothetical protein